MTGLAGTYPITGADSHQSINIAFIKSELRTNRVKMFFVAPWTQFSTVSYKSADALRWDNVITTLVFSSQLHAYFSYYSSTMVQY